MNNVDMLHYHHRWIAAEETDPTVTVRKYWNCSGHFQNHYFQDSWKRAGWIDIEVELRRRCVYSLILDEQATFNPVILTKNRREAGKLLLLFFLINVACLQKLWWQTYNYTCQAYFSFNFFLSLHYWIE